MKANKRFIMPAVKSLQGQILDWFDRHQRVLPWRAPRGHRPDPYHVWLSEIMLQQTTVVTVGPYFLKFLQKWPTVQKLAAATQDEVLAAWAGLGYYARARNLHKCAQTVARDYGGKFPDTEEGLRKLPGIGPYTAAAIASIAFDRNATAVDGNVERVISRMFKIETPLPKSKPEIKTRAKEVTAGSSRPGDLTQALMELGATVCTPRNPKCSSCPWMKSCTARKAGIAAELPRKGAKKEKPLRYGTLFWVEDGDGRFLIRKRPETGLLGGMYEIPSGEWTQDKPPGLSQPPAKLKWKKTGLTVRHTFTHFHLILEIATAKVVRKRKGEVWVTPREAMEFSLPSVMRKAVRLVTAANQD